MKKTTLEEAIENEKIKLELGFKTEWYHWIPYVLGWLLVLSPIFWIIQAGGYYMYNYGEKFFGVNFNRRTYYLGLFLLIFEGIWLLFLIIPLLFSIGTS